MHNTVLRAFVFLATPFNSPSLPVPPMSDGVTKVGEAQAFKSLSGLRQRFRLGLTDASHRAGQLLVRTTQQGMQNAGGGRVYPGQKRQSSAPGGYPAIQSAQLYGSITYEANANQLRFGSTGAHNKGFDYAIAQQEGTSKMAARPYAHLAVRSTKGQIDNIMGAHTWRYIIGGG